MEFPQRSNARKPASKVGSSTPVRSSRQTTSKTKAAVKANPLFLQSDDDADQGNAVQEDETLKSDSGGGRRKPLARKKPVKPPSRSKKQPVVVDDDSDDDGVFQGFKARG